MNRNVESHFSELPQIDIERSTFDRSCDHITSFDSGLLIPFFVDEVLAGDTFKITTSCVVRLQTPLTPIMSNIYMDTYYFFCPSRILWTHFKEFMGENTESAWIPSTEYTIPQTIPPSGGWNVGTIADYMGIPVGIHNSGNTMLVQPSNLPFRAYAMICDQWFRDQNLTDPVLLNLGDSNTSGSNGTNYIIDLQKGGAPFKVAKYHDYFTSCLPAPQKNANINLLSNFDVNDIGRLGNEIFAPVVTRADAVPSVGTNVMKGIREGATSEGSLRLIGTGTPYDVQFGGSSGYGFSPSNLWADLSAANLTINDLRIAFQLQKYYERCARGGTRFREILQAHFGVTTSDARVQIPEYLGGHRFPLSIHQVANQSQGESDFLGDLGALSNTSDIHEDFVKSFEEPGYIIGCACVRYDRNYSQGMERFWRRKKALDFYLPVFSNIGEQPVYTSEIYWSLQTGGIVDPVFGYQEAYADYRFKPSRISGEMRPGVTNSLASWHLGDYYSAKPTLSDGWIREDKSNIDRVLSVTSEVAHQVFADFYVKNIVTRPMPMYSIPGLIDHH